MEVGSEGIKPPEDTPELYLEAMNLAGRVYEGKTGPGGITILEHSTNVFENEMLTSTDEKIVGLFHDAASYPAYSTLSGAELEEEMRAIGCSDLAINMVKCFNRPSDATQLSYKEYIFYLKRNPLTRKVKTVDAFRQPRDFIAERPQQQEAWENAHKWLVSDEVETSEMTHRINAAMKNLGLPNLGEQPWAPSSSSGTQI